MLKNLYIFNFIICTCILLTTACKKDTTIIEVDYSSPKIHTESAIQQNDDTFILKAEITQLNDIEIVEHGFAIQRQISHFEYDAEQFIKLNTLPSVGEVETSYRPAVKPREGDKFRYYYYIKTQKGYYKSTSKEIFVHNINITTTTLSAPIGERITLQGDFSKIDPSSYKLYTDDSTTPVSFTLNTEKTALSFHVAASVEAIHGTTINYVLQSKYDQVGNSIKMLAAIKVLAVLAAPPQASYRFLDVLELKGLGLPRNDNPNTTLQVLINDYKIPFKKVINFTDLPGFNAKHVRLGYYNGRDTIWFDKQYQMMLPAPQDIVYSRNKIHPNSLFVVKGFQFEAKNPATAKHLLGDYTLQVTSSYFDEYSCFVTDIPDGTYTYKYTSDLYTLPSSNAITVNALQVNTPDKKDYYLGEDIPLTGNFIKDQEYYIKAIENSLYQSFTCKEEGMLYPEFGTSSIGDVEVYVGYPAWGGSTFPAKITLIGKGATVDSFSPTKGYQGQLITIRGRGVHLVSSILIGDMRIEYNIERKKNEIKFILPNTPYKGLVKMGLFINNQYYSFDDYFEIL